MLQRQGLGSGFALRSSYSAQLLALIAILVSAARGLVSVSVRLKLPLPQSHFNFNSGFARCRFLLQHVLGMTIATQIRLRLRCRLKAGLGLARVAGAEFRIKGRLEFRP